VWGSVKEILLAHMNAVLTRRHHAPSDARIRSPAIESSRLRDQLYHVRGSKWVATSAVRRVCSALRRDRRRSGIAEQMFRRVQRLVDQEVLGGDCAA
jgi:hypothetical protein